MSERGWVTLAVRLFGLWFLLSGGAAMLGILGTVFWTLAFGDPSVSRLSSLGVLDNPFFVLQSVPSILQALAGCYLLFKGDWLIDRICRQIVGRCSGCGYDITKCTSESCPECNAPLRRKPGGECEGKSG